MTLITTNRKIYWFDTGMGVIERSDYDGMNREIVQKADVTSSIGTSFYLDTYGNMCYVNVILCNGYIVSVSK